MSWVLNVLAPSLLGISFLPVLLPSLSLLLLPGSLPFQMHPSVKIFVYSYSDRFICLFHALSDRLSSGSAFTLKELMEAFS